MEIEFCSDLVFLWSRAQAPHIPKPKELEQDEHDRNPEQRAGFLSQLMYGYVSPMISLGYKRPLQLEDLWKIHPYARLVRCVSTFAACQG